MGHFPRPESTTFRSDVRVEEIDRSVLNPNVTQSVTPDLQWQWMRPDRQGLWAWGGDDAEVPDGQWWSAIRVIDVGMHKYGWWCLLVDDLVEIKPPEKPPQKKHKWFLFVRRQIDPRDPISYDRNEFAWIHEDCTKAIAQSVWENTGYSVERES